MLLLYALLAGAVVYGLFLFVKRPVNSSSSSVSSTGPKPATPYTPPPPPVPPPIKKPGASTSLATSHTPKGAQQRQVALPSIPPYILIIIGVALFSIGLIGQVKFQVFSVEWTWYRFLLWAIVVGIIGGAIAIKTENGTAIAIVCILVVILLIGSVGSIAMSFIGWVKEPPLSSQHTILKTSANSWEITYRYSRGVSTGISLSPGQRLSLTGSNPFTTNCSQIGKRIDSRPSNGSHVATVSYKDCNGEIGVQSSDYHTADKSGFNRIYAVVQ